MSGMTYLAGLDQDARATIRLAGLTLAEYARAAHGPDASAQRWHGDSCGCWDDRCRDGFHHDPHEPCGCLPVLIEQVRQQKQQQPAAG